MKARLLTLAFGLAFGIGGASAFGPLDCFDTCNLELAECLDTAGNDSDLCRATYRNCRQQCSTPIGR